MRELNDKEKQIYQIIASKLKLEPIQNLKLVGLTRKTERYIMKEPIAYKVKGTDTYIAFGNMGQGYDLKKLQEHIAKLQASLAVQEEQKRGDELCNESHEHTEKSEEMKDTSGLMKEIEDNLTKIVTREEEEIKPEDILNSSEMSNVKNVSEEKVKIIMEEANVSREKAAEILARNDDDVIKALIELNK
ncbi:hypothetical protein H311_01274 [Anncaliia algerae PRA109]|nr:hypothetical protein H311_01274 [Anncaliia algerae PRA109]